MTWPPHEVRPLDLESFDERFRRYRLISPADQKQMAASLLRDGQLSPVVVCQLDQPGFFEGTRTMKELEP